MRKEIVNSIYCSTMKKYILLFSLIFVLFSCVKNNPDPAWLEVTEWTLIENVDPQSYTGELTHNFTNAWVFVDDQLIGVFEVPFKIPILMDGAKEVRIYPTILNNGISATKKIYPFVVPHSETVTLVPNETVTINPVTKYYNNTQFWIEDFEGGDKFTEHSSSTASMLKNNDPQYAQWGFYGELNLSDAQDLWIGDSESMSLPQQNSEVYLEIDYYNTNSLDTRLLAYVGTDVTERPNIRLNAQSADDIQWKKIYIELREVVSGSTNATSFKQRLYAKLDTEGTNTKILIDNIKVVHF